MLDVDMASLYRWGGRLRSSTVPFAPPIPSGGQAGPALAAWTAQMRVALDALDADLERFGAAVIACADNYRDVA
jgi:hypothetical protein